MASMSNLKFVYFGIQQNLDISAGILQVFAPKTLWDGALLDIGNGVKDKIGTIFFIIKEVSHLSVTEEISFIMHI